MRLGRLRWNTGLGQGIACTPFWSADVRTILKMAPVRAWSMKWQAHQQLDYTWILSIIYLHLPGKCRRKKFHWVILDQMATKSWETRGKHDQTQRKKLVMAPQTTILPLCQMLLMMVLMMKKATLKATSLLIVVLKIERNERREKLEKVVVSDALNFGAAAVSWRLVEGEKEDDWSRTSWRS